MLENIFLKEKLLVRSVKSILKALPFHFFGYKKLIYYSKDLENVLNERYAHVKEKTCVKLFKSIKHGDSSHENLYFGQWKQ